MQIDTEQSDREVKELFESLAPVVEDVSKKYSANVDRIICSITDANALTNDEIRNLMLELSVETFFFGTTKDISLMKQECATTLLKEGVAKSYNETAGTQAVRTNQSFLDTTDKLVVSMVYNAVANNMKTKIDEAHRVVNVLNSILISRNAEAKIDGERYSSSGNEEKNIL